MSNVLIARTSTASAKFEELEHRNDIALDAAVLERALGAAVKSIPALLLEGDDCAAHYNLDIFTPKGEAYSVQLVHLWRENWAFNGSDEAFFIFCRWYVSIGGRAKVLRSAWGDELAAAA